MLAADARAHCIVYSMLAAQSRSGAPSKNSVERRDFAVDGSRIGAGSYAAGDITVGVTVIVELDAQHACGGSPAQRCALSEAKTLRVVGLQSS